MPLSDASNDAVTERVQLLLRDGKQSSGSVPPLSKLSFSPPGLAQVHLKRPGSSSDEERSPERSRLSFSPPGFADLHCRSPEPDADSATVPTTMTGGLHGNANSKHRSSARRPDRLDVERTTEEQIAFRSKINRLADELVAKERGEALTVTELADSGQITMLCPSQRALKAEQVVRQKEMADLLHALLSAPLQADNQALQDSTAANETREVGSRRPDVPKLKLDALRGAMNVEDQASPELEPTEPTPAKELIDPVKFVWKAVTRPHPSNFEDGGLKNRMHHNTPGIPSPWGGSELQKAADQGPQDWRLESHRSGTQMLRAKRMLQAAARRRIYSERFASWQGKLLDLKTKLLEAQNLRLQLQSTRKPAVHAEEPAPTPQLLPTGNTETGDRSRADFPVSGVGGRTDVQESAIEDYTEMFRQIDENGDGQISQIEFIRALRRDSALALKLGLPHVIHQEDESRRLFESTFHELDADNSKTISLSEWLRFYCPGHTADINSGSSSPDAMLYEHVSSVQAFSTSSSLPQQHSLSTDVSAPLVFATRKPPLSPRFSGGEGTHIKSRPGRDKASAKPHEPRSQRVFAASFSSPCRRSCLARLQRCGEDNQWGVVPAAISLSISQGNRG